jgi:hypothetical protein
MEPNMELKMMQDLHKIELPAINYDWFCNIYHCKMSRSACERRQELAKYTGVNQYRAQYSDTCGNCRQVKKGAKMIVEEIETITVDENETTRACRKCNSVLPMADFTKNKECAGGYEWTCRKCRLERQKLAKASRQSAAKMSTAKTQTAPVEPYCPPVGLKILNEEYRKYKKNITEDEPTISPLGLPVGLPPGVSINPVSGSDDFPLTKDFICDYDHSVTLDFSYHPDMLKSVLDAAKCEFRTPAMQILFMLSKYVD